MSEEDQLFNPDLRQVLVVIGKHLIRDQVRNSTASDDWLVFFYGNRVRGALTMPALTVLRRFIVFK